ncbi:MAG: zinc-ribbon domain-containing protein [Thermodesulfobacteriota bacterium]
MIIKCNKCAAKFKVDDSKIPDKGAKIRCKKCQHIFKVEKPQTTAAEQKPVEFVSPTTLPPVNEKEEGHDKTQEPQPTSEVEHGGFWGADLTGSGEPSEEEVKEVMQKTGEEEPSLSGFETDFGISKEVEKEDIREEDPFKDSLQNEFIASEEGTPNVSHIKKSRIPSLKNVLLLILLLVIAGGGIYFGSDFVSNMFRSTSGNTESSEQNGTLGLSRLKGYYHDNKQSGRFFVVEGRLINPWNFPIISDKVKGTIFDNNGKKMQEKTVSSGVVLTKNQLNELSAENIETAFKSQYEKTTVEAGKSLPFMIVFFNVPNDLSEFLVEVSE